MSRVCEIELEGLINCGSAIIVCCVGRERRRGHWENSGEMGRAGAALRRLRRGIQRARAQVAPCLARGGSHFAVSVLRQSSD